MSACVRLICLLLLIPALLVGCQGSRETAFTCQDLTITLPSHCTDLSGEDFAGDADFLYACEIGSFLGIRESKAELKEIYPLITLESYGRLQILAAGQECTLQQKDGIYTYSYTAQSGEESITYLSAVFETQDAYWAVQAYCKSGDFPGNEARLWKYLSSCRG